MPDAAKLGVAFTPPPLDLQPSITRAIASATAAIPPGKSGALVAVINEQGANAAIVAKVGGAWEVQAWIGKTWKADTQYGATIRRSW